MKVILLRIFVRIILFWWRNSQTYSPGCILLKLILGAIFYDDNIRKERKDEYACQRIFKIWSVKTYIFKELVVLP